MIDAIQGGSHADCRRSQRAAIFFALLGFFFGWGPLRGLHQYWAGEPERQTKSVSTTAREELTIDDFHAKLKEMAALGKVTIGRLDCVPDPMGITCTCTPTLHGGAASLLLAGDKGSRRLTEVSLMLRNPAMRWKGWKNDTGLSLILMQSIVRILSPELDSDARIKLLSGLLEEAGGGRISKRRVGPWEYSAAKGAMLSLIATLK